MRLGTAQGSPHITMQRITEHFNVALVSVFCHTAQGTPHITTNRVTGLDVLAGVNYRCVLTVQGSPRQSPRNYAA